MSIALWFAAACASAPPSAPSAPLPSPPAGPCDGFISKPRLKPPYVFPRYTEQARAKGVTGRAHVTVDIDSAGLVTGARFDRFLGSGIDESILTAVRTMKFDPARQCGRAVPSSFTITFNFMADRPPPGW